MRKNKGKIKGFSLSEILLAISLFAIISLMVTFIVIDSTKLLENISTRNKTSEMIEEIYNALLILKSESWYNVARYTGEGEKHFEYDSDTNKYSIEDGENTKNDITYSFTVEDVMRDSERNIVESGGSIDPHTRLINITMSWYDRLGRLRTSNQKLYLNDWDTLSVAYTTKEDFLPGSHDQTIAIDLSGGEVRLQRRFYSDWCRPELSLNKDLSEYDIPGAATPRSVFAQLGHAYLGTRGEPQGEPFTKLNIEGVDPPVVSVEGVFSGYNVNDIFIVDHYAFLATTDNSKEVVILDISSHPYTEIGYFNAPGNDDALTVFVDGNVGYVGQGKYIRSFNLNQYTGSRPEIGSVNAVSLLFQLVGVVSKIKVLDGYLYAVLDWDWYELAIVDVRNPAKMKITSQTSVNNQQVYDMELSEDGTRAYFGTSHSSSEKEFFIMDTSQKSGKRPIIASIDTPNTTIKGISIVQEGNRKFAIIVGIGGQEYQIWNITNEKTPTKCGGMEINSGVYDIDTIRDSYTNAFSYIVTGDHDKEFKIIRGGPGGGGEDGYAYYDEGTYLSQPFDSTSNTAEYYILEIKTEIPPETSIEIQVRASNNSNMSGATWVGPDGTSSTHFSTSGIYDLPSGLKGRYFQYKVFFISNDIEESALLEEIIINYDK